MQLTVRSYLMAGMAAAGAGALAIAPLPSLTQDVTIPTVEAPVALAAAPSVRATARLGYRRYSDAGQRRIRFGE